MPSVPWLSVCIPTYNRPEKLRRLLTTLLPQLTAECELVILDNCSDQSMEACLDDLIAGFKTCPVRVMRNPVNIGANPNILRCFEMAQGDWVWISGDDDLPEPHAIASILEESRSNPETIFINFGSTILKIYGISRPATVRAKGLDGFISSIDNFPNLLFISAGIYRRKHLVGYLRKAYAYIDTCGPHLALVIIGLLNHDEDVVLFSHRQLIHWEDCAANDQWNSQVVHKSLLRLLDLIPSGELRRRWFEKFSVSCPPPLRTYLSSFKYLVSKKGRTESFRDQFEMTSYLASMLPGYRWRLVTLWLISGMVKILWWPIYLVWSLVPADRRGSLASYGHESALTRRFLDEKRL